MESKKYMTFNDELQVMSDYINNTAGLATRLGITDAQTAQVSEYKTQFEAVMLLYRNPATRTAVITNQVAETYKTMHHWVAGLRQGIKHSRSEELTEQDYASLFIHKDKVHHKHTVPETSPTLELEHIEHLNIRISAHHHTTKEKGTRPSLPEGVDMIDWKWVVLDEKPRAGTANSASIVYTNQLNSHSATLKLEFTPDQVGKYCYIESRYGITNGKTGTPSEVLVFAIT